MNCPTCGNRMQGGYLKSETDITWIPDFFSSQNQSSSKNDALLTFSASPSYIYSYRCLICKRIAIDLAQTSKSNTMTCSKCGNSVEATATFCNSCGGELQKSSKESQFTCVNCNNPIESDDITCPSCGVELDEFANDILNTCIECGYSDPSLEDLAECPRCGALLPI